MGKAVNRFRFVAPFRETSKRLVIHLQLAEGKCSEVCACHNTTINHAAMSTAVSLCNSGASLVCKLYVYVFEVGGVNGRQT